jgi:ribonucleoside-diphosphate reductase alpha chain
LNTQPQQAGPQVPFSDYLHAGKYRLPNEGFRECANRVASALQDDAHHYHAFREVLLGMRFLPAGRIQTAMGVTKNVTPYNCYVAGTIRDSFVDGEGSIMSTATEAAATMRMGGGIGYDFSTLRPRGSLIKKLQSRSSGAVSFMHIFDAVGLCTASSGHRRGAQMGILRVDHPDIEEFVHAKQNRHALTGFNISVAVTDRFMEAVVAGKPFPLQYNGEIHREVDAAALWEQIMRSTWDWAEPGVFFVDTVNRMNNLYYCEQIAATNPCGEQPLPPYGACLLGSFNLAKYVSGFGPHRTFDFEQLEADVAVVVRAMDNVVDRARYPLPQQRLEALSKRRMGLGYTALANAGEALGHPYGSPGFLEFHRRVGDVILHASYRASALLAKEKGSFPKYDRDLYMAGQFVKRLPDDVQDAIRRHGIRNSHLTSIAPTGTISLCADNVSSGIEPVFALEADRTVIEFEGPRIERVQDYGLRVFGVKGKTSDEVTVDEHVAVLLAAQSHVDSACSKTCNVPTDIDWDKFKGVYVDAWRGGAKGCTTYRVGGMRGEVIKKAEEPGTVAGEDARGDTCVLVDGKKECG